MIVSGNGVDASIGFMTVAIAVVILVLGFVTLTSHVEKADAFYAYVTRIMEISMGIGVALQVLSTYTCFKLGSMLT